MLIKKVLILSLLLIFNTLPMYAQDCPTCDHFLDFIYDKISIERSQDISSSFSSWFFSSRFEDEIKNSTDGLSMTVLLEGIPITFGGNHESSNAWKLRQENMGSTKWNFSKMTREHIYTQLATPDARNVWLQCVEYACSNKNELFPISKSAITGDPVLTFSYNANLLDQAPLYETFICTGGIDCSLANQTYRDKAMKRLGQAITFKWIDDDAIEGIVILNTSKGASRPIVIKRFSKPNNGTLSYLKTVPGPEKFIGRSTSPFYLSLGTMGEKCGAVGYPACSPYNEFAATLTNIRYNAGPGQIFRNGTVRCASPPGLHCAWIEIMSIDQGDGTYIGAVVKNWSSGTHFVVDVDVYAATTIQQVENSPIEIDQKKIKVTVPISAVFPLVTLTYKDKPILFRPDALISDAISLTNVENFNDRTVYHMQFK